MAQDGRYPPAPVPAWLREALAVVVVALVAAVGVTWPLVLDLREIAHNAADAPFQAWTIDHVQWALTTGRSLWDANIFHPSDHTLAYSDNLVGEIRDRETAVIAAEASLTGHLVLSSLHTNDAASTPLRLLEIGVEPFMVTSAVQAVLAQRLARRLCVRCRAPYEPDDAELAVAGWPAAWLEAEGRPTLHRAVGCQACARTGYRGRFAMHEVLVMTEDLAHLILARAHAEDVRSQAVADGMVPLREDGLRKVAQGATTLEELGRVIA